MLSNTALENLSRTCPEFGPLARYNNNSKALTFEKVTAPKRLRGMEALSNDMHLAEENMTDVALMLVESRCEGDENEGSQVHLHDVFGEVLHLEMEFDYCRALDDPSEYRLKVIQLIIEADQSCPQAEFQHSKKDARAKGHIRALLHQVRRYLQKNNRETVARLAAAKPFIIKRLSDSRASDSSCVKDFTHDDSNWNSIKVSQEHPQAHCFCPRPVTDLIDSRDLCRSLITLCVAYGHTLERRHHAVPYIRHLQYV